MKRFLTALTGVLCALPLLAKVELPSFISDNMVLQQNSDAALWGWTTPGRKVVVNGSWSKKSVSAVADENGKFLVKIPTCEAGGPYTVCFNDGDKTVLSNVLLGEVWFCSGQSPEVEHPVAVRYAFRNWAEATLFNNYGIPVGPFRSDDWDDIKR